MREEVPLRHRGRYGCKIAGVSREICYVRFARTAVVTHSIDSKMKTARGDSMIFDIDAEGRVVGIELLGNKECQTRIAETIRFGGDGDEARNRRRGDRRTEGAGEGQ